MSSEGTTQTKLQLHCNEVEVLSVVLFDVKCSGGEGGVEGGSIEFLIGDSASELYRPYKPSKWRFFTLIDVSCLISMST